MYWNVSKLINFREFCVRNQNKINTDKIISVGFSFGGATAMYNAANDGRYQ